MEFHKDAFAIVMRPLTDKELRDVWYSIMARLYEDERIADDPEFEDISDETTRGAPNTPPVERIADDTDARREDTH